MQKSQANRQEYVLVGLTGSIGSGKSTVADIFEQEGIPVLRADLIAKELMVSDPQIIRAVRDAFGDDAYIDGALNRDYLASTIFTDRTKLDRMNRIVHPRTIIEQGARAAELVEAGHRVVACETALLFETGGEGRFDYIVTVDAEESRRFERAAQRDHASVDDVRRRDEMQISAQRKVEAADFVIRNDGTIEELNRNTKFVIALLKALPPRERIEIDEELPEDDGDDA